MDEVRIWAIEDASTVVALKSHGRVEAESFLEDTLVANPDLLLPDLKLVGRQTPTAGGPLDLLGVDEDGRLCLFELKRGTLTREAVAQVIDYAADLEARDSADLADLLSRESGRRGIERIEDFEQWYGQQFGEPESPSLTPLRIFLVGLGADERAERMVDFLANNSGMDISLIHVSRLRARGQDPPRPAGARGGWRGCRGTPEETTLERGAEEGAAGRAHGRSRRDRVVRRGERHVRKELAWSQHTTRKPWTRHQVPETVVCPH